MGRNQPFVSPLKQHTLSTGGFLNSFPHTDALWRLCSRRRLKTLRQNEIAYYGQFLLLPHFSTLFKKKKKKM